MKLKQLRGKGRAGNHVKRGRVICARLAAAGEVDSQPQILMID